MHSVGQWTYIFSWSTLDLIITCDDEPVANVTVGEFISDHTLVACNIFIATKPFEYISKTICSWKRFNEAAFSVGWPSQTHLPHMMEWSLMSSSTYTTPHSRNYLTNLDCDSASTVVHLFITGRIDYCNGLLASTPVYQIEQLQCVLNAATCLLLRIPGFVRDLQIKVKDKLHWVRMPEQVTYKLCTLVYKSLYGLALSGYNVTTTGTKVQCARVYLACTVSIPSCVDPCVQSICNMYRMPSGWTETKYNEETRILMNSYIVAL